MRSTLKTPVLVWLGSGAFLVFAMVVIGGITRLTHSGLSITEWNVLMGAIPPLNSQEWLVAFHKYQQFPEYKIVNYNISVEEFKSIFWWEFLHRLVGRLIGVVFIFPFLYFYFTKKLSSKLLRSLLGVFLLGALQG